MIEFQGGGGALGHLLIRIILNLLFIIWHSCYNILSLVCRQVCLLSKRNKNLQSAFTMAEVLIVLGILGIIAALTLMQVLTKVDKKVASVKVYKFYSMINQAVAMSTLHNGNIDGWFYGGKPVASADTANITYENNRDFVETYFTKYMRAGNCENYMVGSKNENDKRGVKCMMESGDAVIFAIYKVIGGDIGISVDIYYVTNFTAMSKRHVEGNFLTDTRYVYYFSMRKETFDDNMEEVNSNLNNKIFVGPYSLNWDGTVEGLTKTGTQYSCSKKGYTFYPAYCTKLLELNGWEFPDNYPW